MKIKKILISSFLVLTIALSLGGGTLKVQAADPDDGRYFKTWMQIDDNVLFTGRARTFLKGRNTIMISFDKWNSSICKKDTDTSKVIINLYDNINKRTVSAKELTSQIGLCGIGDFGTQAKSEYIHYFATFDNKQNKYCGYRSDTVVMESIA